MTLLDGVRDRLKAPFFDALRAYANRPIGNFRALPIARGHSVFNSRWGKSRVLLQLALTRTRDPGRIQKMLDEY
jgi:arginine/lysine/ornithine decarboxylase